MISVSKLTLISVNSSNFQKKEGEDNGQDSDEGSTAGG